MDPLFPAWATLRSAIPSPAQGTLERRSSGVYAAGQWNSDYFLGRLRRHLESAHQHFDPWYGVTATTGGLDVLLAARPPRRLSFIFPTPDPAAGLCIPPLAAWGGGGSRLKNTAMPSARLSGLPGSPTGVLQRKGRGSYALRIESTRVRRAAARPCTFPDVAVIPDGWLPASAPLQLAAWIYPHWQVLRIERSVR